MTRWSVLLVAILGLGGCAGAQTLSESCASLVAQSEAASELAERSACTEPAAGPERIAALGAVRQTGSQTRTVGVPREFLVAMVVIVVLVALL